MVGGGRGGAQPQLRDSETGPQTPKETAKQDCTKGCGHSDARASLAAHILADLHMPTARIVRNASRCIINVLMWSKCVCFGHFPLSPPRG